MFVFVLFRLQQLADILNWKWSYGVIVRTIQMDEIVDLGECMFEDMLVLLHILVKR